jgi:signal transduction histidine kinase/CheY-like chemotaxis protein
MHRLLERQLKKVGRLAGAADDPLIHLIDEAYHELDRERARQDRTHRALSEEVEALNASIRGEAEARVRAVFDHVLDGIVVVDDDGVVDSINPAAEQLFAVRGGVAVGQPFSSLWGGAPPSLRVGTTEQALAHADGTETPLELTSSVCSIGDRKKHVIIVRDLSGARHATAMREAVVRAEAETRAKSSFLASMSHEIRTPMNGVLGMATLLSDSELTPGQRTCVDTIRDSGTSLMALLDDILDLSKIEAGRMPIEEVEFSPLALVESVVDLCAPRAFDKGVAIGVLVAPEVPAAVRGDSVKVRQILSNLVGNAAKFTSEGSITVSVTSSPVPGEPGVARVAFDVIDTGIGIPEHVIPRLFSEFEQADSSTTRRFGGTGLGLAICKRLVGMLGGRIAVESAPGRGSTFAFVLPLPTVPTPEVTPRPSGLRVWVVEAEARTAGLLMKQLDVWGVSAEHYLGEAALRAQVSNAGAPDVLVVSRELADGGAERVVEHVRGGRGGAATRVVLLSGRLDDARCAGCDAVLLRPVRPTALSTQLVLARASDLVTVAPPSGPRPRRAEQRGLRVLLVEDNKVNQLVAAGMMRRAGHVVEIAENGQQAVAAVAAQAPDLILMDMQMPGMDGLEATRVIRASRDSLRRAVPIIALTANAMSSDREACIAAGMNDYLTKPIDRAQLLAKLERWSHGVPVAHQISADLCVPERIVRD